MRILDRYVLLEYLRTFIIIVMSFCVVFIIVDVFERLPRLMRIGAGNLDILLYFASRLPYLFVLVSPIAVLLSGLFLMNTLSKYNESIAIRAAGISIRRMFAPLLWFCFFFSVGMAFFTDLVVPRAEDYRNYVYNVRIKGSQPEDIRMRSNIHYRGKNNNLFFIGFFDGYRNNLKTVDITLFNHKTGRVEKKIQAAEATWQDNRWVLSDCYIRTFENGTPVLSVAAPVYHASISIPEMDISPDDFVKKAKKADAMNYLELREYIRQLEKIGESNRHELTDLHFKVSFPFANFIIILFSIPLASTSTRSKGRGLVFLLGIVVCFLYLSLLRFSMSLGYNGVLSPLTAAWVANALFLTVGVLFTLKAEV